MVVDRLAVLAEPARTGEQRTRRVRRESGSESAGRPAMQGPQTPQLGTNEATT